MDLTFSPAEEAFRSELRAWLAANVPAERVEHATLADEVAASIGRASTAGAAPP